jgi:hypothetical protein
MVLVSEGYAGSAKHPVSDWTLYKYEHVKHAIVHSSTLTNGKGAFWLCADFVEIAYGGADCSECGEGGLGGEHSGRAVQIRVSGF